MIKKQDLPRCSAVIVAAGSSRRMGSIDKQMLLISGIPVLAHTLMKFENIECVGEIIVVAKRESLEEAWGIVESFKISKVKEVVPGGKTRAKSVVCGLKRVGNFPIVMIHDGARPFVSERLIEETVLAAAEFGAAAPGVIPKDTVKEISSSNSVIKTPKRDMLRLIQTPQTFEKQLIVAAYENAEKNGFEGTDDCSVAEFAGADIKITDGEYTNIKITTPADIPIAEAQAEIYRNR